MKKTEFEQAIEHFKKLLNTDQFIITGSYSLYLLGLTNNVTDLDVILINPDEKSEAILKRIAEPPPPEYPERGGYYPVLFQNIKIDFWVKHPSKQFPKECIELKNGMDVAYPLSTVKAKQGYKKLKQILQLKILSEKIYTPQMLKEVLDIKEKDLCNKGVVEEIDDFRFKTKK